MAEVPEHLLQRSRERRAALEGGPPPEPAAAAPVAASAAAPPSETGGVPAPAVAPAAPVPAAPPPPPRPRPGPSRVPVWVVPALAALPLWGFLYLGIFGERGAEAHTVSGAQVYSSNCASCHGAGGEGGVGPALEDGASVQTFPDEAAHLDWVKTGSQPFAGEPYGATGKIATGGMPGFEGSLSEEEIQAVVTYEREGL